MKTTDIGPLFFAAARFHSNRPRLPFFGLLPNQESEPPYRFGLSLFVRVPFTPFGGIVGWWQKRDPEDDGEEALLAALGGTVFEGYTGLFDDLDDDDKRAVRDLVAEYVGDDWDTEWEVVNMLGLEDV